MANVREQSRASWDSSERTIRRQLQVRGTNYKKLVDEVRHDLASRQLRLGAPLSDIAERLGFHGSRALHKAFVRWTKLTPSRYRELLLRQVASPSDDAIAH